MIEKDKHLQTLPPKHEQMDRILSGQLKQLHLGEVLHTSSAAASCSLLLNYIPDAPPALCYSTCLLQDFYPMKEDISEIQARIMKI
mmetsp:Transcript_10265/g.13372  ORF Transcript_10265/g.13372 Transcript_10265/m.13372 type:complete len:86 (-) Transcript_10265:347-604(-)